EDEDGSGLVGAAVAQADDARRAIEVCVEIETVDIRARVVARSRRLQRQSGQRAHLAQRLRHFGLRYGYVVAQLRAERFEPLEMRPGIAVDADFADSRLGEVDAQHADLEQPVVELGLRSRV